jgi:hypothetical protein
MVREVACCDTVRVALPEDLYHIIWDSVMANCPRPKYARVIMKLEQILSGDFFTKYIKKGGHGLY